MLPADRDLLTVEEVARYLGCHPRTVYRYIRAGQLTAIKLGREYRIKRADLDRFLEERKTG
jgi:excisionase family DNA binding protein